MKLITISSDNGDEYSFKALRTITDDDLLKLKIYVAKEHYQLDLSSEEDFEDFLYDNVIETDYILNIDDVLNFNN